MHRLYQHPLSLAALVGCASVVAPDSPSGVEGVSCDAVVCPTGFECYDGGCVRGCATDLDCGPWRCAPLPGATFGVCVEPRAVAPQTESGEVPSAPASEAPGSLPAPATPAPAPDDEPQAEVTPVGPEAPEDDAASPPVPAPGPANCAYPRDDGRFAVGLVPPHVSFPQALDWGANATVVVVGYQGARARYSLRLTLR